MRTAIVLALSWLGAGMALAQPINLHPVPPSGQNPELPNLLLEFPGDVPQATPPPVGPTYSLQLEGAVASLGPGEVVVRDPRGAESRIAVRPETVITMEGAPVTFDEIPAGSEVRVSFDLQGSRWVATEIDAAPKGQEVPVDPAAPPPVSTEIPGTSDGRLLPPAAPAPAPLVPGQRSEGDADGGTEHP